jgi:hypothetical protein
MIKTPNILILLICILFVSCTKEAGYGGLGSITGKVYAVDYTPAGIIEAEGYAPDMKVVIAVSGSSTILDETRTNLDGTYSFEELRKGDYVVYSFTECDTCTNNETPVVIKATLENNKSSVTAEDIIINI